MRGFIFFLMLISTLQVIGQVSGPLIAMSNSAPKFSIPDSSIKRMSSSESPKYTFIVNPNVKENRIRIETNYKGEYKIRFVDYYGKSIKVYKDVYSNKLIDITELGKGIFIMNITDAQNHKLLTSQVVNLKRRHL